MNIFIFLSIILSLSVILIEKFIFTNLSLVIFTIITLTFIFFLKKDLDIKLYRGFLIYVFLFLISLTYCQIRAKSKLDFFKGKERNLNLHILEVIKFKEDYSTYRAKLSYVEDKLYKKVGEEVILNLSGKTRLKRGDSLKIKGRIESPSENTNPKLFNYRLYLKSNNISYIVRAKEKDLLYISKGKKKKDFLPFFAFKSLEKRKKSFIEGIVSGNTEKLTREDLNKFRDLGLAHILAVSGLHLGILSVFVLRVLAFLGISLKISSLLVIALASIYTYKLGFPVSIVRSTSMLGLFLISIIKRRYYRSIDILFFIYFIYLIYNPFILYSLSFQLSFLATFSVLVFPKRIKKKLVYKKNSLIDSLIVILSVQLGLLPVQLYYFNKYNIFSLLANFLILPLIGLALPLIFTILMIYPILPQGLILALLIKSLDKLLDLLFFILDKIYLINFGRLEYKSPNIYFFFLYYLSLAFFLGYIEIKKYPLKINKACLIYLLSLSLVFTLTYKEDYICKLSFIDVGQGDACLISGFNKNFLIDTGGSILGEDYIGEHIVLPYLKKHGVFKIDGIFISHFDEDHCRSILKLMEDLKIESIFIPYLDRENNLCSKILSSAKNKKINVKLLKEGMNLRLGEDLIFKILAPKEDILKRNLSDNEKSQVILAEIYGKTILFTGDIEKEAEKSLIVNDLPKLDLLKVAHHGSNSSSTIEFLEKTQPKYAIISVGRKNFYNHPSKEVLNRLKLIESKIYRTDRDGMVRLGFQDGVFEISTYLPKRVNFLDFIYKNITSYMSSFFVILILIREYKRGEVFDL